jgi:hypothetical protein
MMKMAAVRRTAEATHEAMAENSMNPQRPARPLDHWRLSS